MSYNNIPDNESNDPLNSRLEADVTHLNTLLSNGTLDGSDETEDLMEILARLESADGMARGVEGKLDEILGTLDNLLISLETPCEAEILDNERSISVEVERVTVTSAESDHPSEPAVAR